MRVVILTGAGISAESGLGTFRDADGLWAKYDPMTLATPAAFARHPERVYEFYNMRRRNLRESEPNAAHKALARLESRPGVDLLTVTQNVDDLHERAGSRNVLHMHGELKKVRCLSCGAVAVHEGDLGLGTTCTACGAAGRLRPHIVWFGEVPMHMEEIEAALDDCDLFAAIGTSGTVYPAAGFVSHVRALGHARTVEINLEPSGAAALFDEHHYGPATRAVPAWVADFVGG